MSQPRGGEVVVLGGVEGAREEGGGGVEDGEAAVEFAAHGIMVEVLGKASSAGLIEGRPAWGGEMGKRGMGKGIEQAGGWSTS